MKNRIAKGLTNVSLKTPALVLDAISSEKLQPPTLASVKRDAAVAAAHAKSPEPEIEVF